MLRRTAKAKSDAFFDWQRLDNMSREQNSHQGRHRRAKRGYGDVAVPLIEQAPHQPYGADPQL